MNLGLSRYHIGVIVIYILLIPGLLFLTQKDLTYDLTSNNLVPVTVITLAAITVFLFFLLSKSKVTLPKVSQVILAVMYGLLFALPEEILFRAFIQDYLQISLNNLGVAVFLSALIYGIAHVLNGAKSFALFDLNWQLMGLTFLAGIPLGLLFALTGSLLIPTALHAFFVAGLQLSRRN